VAGIINISEATALALHALIYLEAQDNERVTTHEMAEGFKASEAHLAKVMQRLVKAGYVESVRGPGGGFRPAAECGSITFHDIYELFEGPLGRHVCLFNKPVCNGHCIMGDLLHDVQKLVSSYMKNTTLCNAATMMKEGRIRVGTDYSEN